MKIKLEYLEEDRQKDKIKSRNNIALYLFGVKIKKIKIDRTVHGTKNSNKLVDNSYMIAKQIIRATKNKKLLKVGNKIVQTIKIEKLDLKLGINLQDPIINAYSVALLNAILPTFLAYKQVATHNLKYETFISQKVIYLDAFVTVRFPVIKNIPNLIQILIILLQEKIEVKKASKRGVS